MATLDQPHLALLGTRRSPRRCISLSSSTESLNTTNSSHGPLVTRIGKLSLQPKLNHSKQLVKAANSSIRKLLCGFAVDSTQDDSIPLIELSSLSHSRGALQFDDNEDSTLLCATSVDCAKRALRDSAKLQLTIPSVDSLIRSGGLLRKSNSTSTVNALNVEMEQRTYQERPSCIHLRSSSAVVTKRVRASPSEQQRTPAPKPSPATTESHKRLATDMEDNVRYVTVYPSSEFSAPPEPLGSLIKAIYGIVKNPLQFDAETRSKAIKLRLKVTIHPEGNQKCRPPDTPKSITSSSSNKAVAERGHRWSRPATYRTYPPSLNRASRPVRRKCRHHSSTYRRKITVPQHCARRNSSTDAQQESVQLNHARPAAWPTGVHVSHRRHLHSSAQKNRQDETLLRAQAAESVNCAWQEAAHAKDNCRHSRHSREAYRMRSNLLTVDRIQHVVDWLHKADNDFSVKWPEMQMPAGAAIESKAVRDVNGRRKRTDNMYRHLAKTAQDVVRMTEWEWQVGS